MFSRKRKLVAPAVLALALLGAFLSLGRARAEQPGDAPIKIEYHGWFSNPVFTADGKTMIYGRLKALKVDDRTAPTDLILWDVAAGKQIKQIAGPTDDSLLGALAVAPDGNHVALNMWNTAVRLWDLKAGKETGRIEKSQGAMQIRFTPDGNTLGYLRNGDITLADPAAGKAIRNFGKEDKSPVTTFTFVDGKTVIGGHATSKVTIPGGKNPTVEYQVSFWAYDTATGKKLHQVGATSTDTRKLVEGMPPHGVFLSGGGKALILATRNDIQECDATTGKKNRDIPVPWKLQADDPVKQLTMAANAPILAVMTGKGVIGVWDLAAGKEIRRIETGQYLEHFALSPNGKTLAVTHQTPGKVGAVLLIYAL